MAALAGYWPKSCRSKYRDEVHPDNNLIERCLKGRLTTHEHTEFKIRLLEQSAQSERVQLVVAMNQGLQQQDESQKATATPTASALPFRGWIRQPQSMAASLLLLVMAWPVLKPLLVSDPAPPLAIASVLLLKENQGEAEAAFNGAPPYLLQFAAGPGNDAVGFTATLQAEGGNRLLLGQRLAADADGWVRIVIPTSLNGRYQAELVWNDTAGITQRRQFTFGVNQGKAP